MSNTTTNCTSPSRRGVVQPTITKAAATTTISSPLMLLLPPGTATTPTPTTTTTVGEGSAGSSIENLHLGNRNSNNHLTNSATNTTTNNSGLLLGVSKNIETITNNRRNPPPQTTTTLFKSSNPQSRTPEKKKNTIQQHTYHGIIGSSSSTCSPTKTTTTTLIIPKNPKDTTTTTSLNATNSTIEGGGGINPITSPSPNKRRIKKSSASSSTGLTSHTTGIMLAASSSSNNSNHPIPSQHSSLSFSNQSVGSGVRSVKSYRSGGGGGGGGTKSGPVNAGMTIPTPGSVDGLQSIKDVITTTTAAATTTANKPNNNNNFDSIIPTTTMITSGATTRTLPIPITNTTSPIPHLSSSLDDEEQSMFEQRLSYDELGVAIRKISHSGKAQLRYVKCVPLRPPSSSDFDEDVFVDGRGMVMSSRRVLSSQTTMMDPSKSSSSPLPSSTATVNATAVQLLSHQGMVGNTAATTTTTTTLIPSDTISVSSKSTTGSRRFLERLRSSSASASGARIGGGGSSSTTSRLFHNILPPGGNTMNLATTTLVSSSSPRNGREVGGGGVVGVGGNSVVGGNILSSNNDTDDEEGCDDSDNHLLLPNDSSNHHHHHEGDFTTEGILGSSSKSHRALTWGKKNAVVIPLDKFLCVRKGKTTERTMRNTSSSSRLLSILTNVRGNESLDIEAPTMLDRDKFAIAFSRFLGVPLVEEEESMEWSGGERSSSGYNAPSSWGGGRSTTRSTTFVGGGSAVMKKIRTPSITRTLKLSSTLSAAPSTARSEPGRLLFSSSRLTPHNASSESLLPTLTLNSDEASALDRELTFEHGFGKETIESNANAVRHPPRKTSENDSTLISVVKASSSSLAVSRTGSSRAGETTMSKHTIDTMSESARKRISLDTGHAGRESMLEPRNNDSSTLQGANVHVNVIGATKDENNNKDMENDIDDNHSHVSSLTGGVDQEIVEELHQAIIELRAELDTSRAEAARAVKVAEQAIQSAENCTSSDWNSTVTHKAAEAAAQAQRKSAEAIARARVAEERLAAERKSAKFWRVQAQAAEEEAGGLKTRSAAAEVRQAIITEELASERRKAARIFATLKKEFQAAEKKQEGEMIVVLDKKRMLEVELNELKESMEKKKSDSERLLEKERNEKSKGPHRLRPNFRRQRDPSCPKPKDSVKGSHSVVSTVSGSVQPQNEGVEDRISEVQRQAIVLKKQFEILRLTSMDGLQLLKQQSEEWSKQAFRAVAASTAESDHLREKLAAESTMRLKLLNSLQDIRGTVRVYCRPKPIDFHPGSTQPKSVLTIPTHDILVLNEKKAPVSFQFDRIFSPRATQCEVFSELEEPLISSLDGFNVTLLAYGQGGSGKTHSLLGDLSFDDEGSGDPILTSHGVQLQAIEQLFNIASHRTERYKDKFSITMVEVHNEKLFDRISGIPSADEYGEVVVCETKDRRDTIGNWPKGKLEIRTNIDGNTVVQGLVSIPIESFEKVLTILQESISYRTEQLRGQGSDWKKHHRKTTLITTIQISSVNIATGVGTEGRLQFVDMAASDITLVGTKLGDDSISITGCGQIEGDDAQYVNRSIDAFNEVIHARCQFDRSVPYRNSTLTHLLRDSLEADTKVLLLCCINSDEANLPNTLSSLRFASRMQKVSIGKATKHVIGTKE